MKSLDFHVVETKHVLHAGEDFLAGVRKVSCAVFQAGNLALQVAVLVPFAISKLRCVEQGFALFDDSCVSHFHVSLHVRGEKSRLSQ